MTSLNLTPENNIESSDDSLSELTSDGLSSHSDVLNTSELTKRVEELDKLIKEGRGQLELIYVNLYKYEKEKEDLLNSLKRNGINIFNKSGKEIDNDGNESYLKLTGENKDSASNELNGRKRPIRLRPNQKKQLVLDYESKQYTIKELCKKYNIVSLTIYSIVKSFEKKRNGSVDDEIVDNGFGDEVLAKGRKSRLNTDHIGALLYELENAEEMGYSASELRSFTSSKFNFTTDCNTILKRLSKVNCMWKTTTPIPFYWNETEILAQRKKYIYDIEEYEYRCAFYLDEISINMDQTADYSWALRGKTTTPSTENPINLIVAVSLNKIPTLKTFVDSKVTTAKHIKEFILEYIEIFRGQIIFLDDSRHHRQLLDDADLLNSLKEFDIVYQLIPKYSPFLNPCEYFFNKLMLCVKHSTFTNRDELVEVVKYLINELSDLEIIEDFLAKAKFYHRASKNLEPVTGLMINDPEEAYRD